jgi:hypothetical protein
MKKLIIGLLAGAATTVTIVGLVIYFWFFRKTPALDASLSVLQDVGLDATVALTVTATNSHNQPVILDSIDIDDSFLAGFQVITVEPKPSSTTHLSLGHQRSWDFGNSVSPHGTQAVIFTLRAISEGHFSGDVDVCNPNQDYKTVLADVVVKNKHSTDHGEANGSERSRSNTNSLEAASPR